jgi:hypothetical protein
MSSFLYVAKNDSETALSKQVARRPMERCTPWMAQKSANSFEVYWQPTAVEDHPSWRFSGEYRDGEGLDDQTGPQVIGHGVTLWGSETRCSVLACAPRVLPEHG